MARHGKKYREAFDKIDRDQAYDPGEALRLVKESAFAKFDETVEVHIRLGVDPRHAEQQVRETVMMPHGLGKSVVVVVFAEGDAARAAKEAGADYVADADLIKQIEGGWTGFDATVATPQMMGTVGKLGRVLGPRGLMPNPKAGTVVPEDDLGRVIDELKSGRVEFRVDRTANLHVPIGKVSFELDQLSGNFAALMEAVKHARPASAKGTYVRSVTISSTMGPGVKVDPLAAQALG
ncbi:MAG TPA: 50S ribosomal protein L1 [Anaerolineales bacterium]|jgi:large subunit ribosomal protein L1